MTSKALHEWHRKVALDIAQAFPLTAHGIKRTGPAKVGGAHLSDASNEPDPSCADDTHLAEEARVAADLAYSLDKGQRKAAENDARARELDQQHFDVLRVTGAL